MPAANTKPKILLIGWDAADWKVITPLMEQGKMPNLSSLIERGVMGNLATLQPVLSPMLWTSIATGKRPFKHGILGFSEPTPDGGGVQPVSQLSRTTKAIWNMLNQEGYRSSVVGWWPSHPVEHINGVMVSNHYHHAVAPPDQPWPMAPGTVHPHRLQETLAELRFNPNELVAEEVLHFLPRALEIDQGKDRRVASVMKILAECVSINNAATWLMQNEEWDFFAVYYDAIDHFCHGFMKYHPPRQDWISEPDFELYSGVVNAGYIFHDMMLGTKLKLVDENTTIIICSDHGFHPDHLRPRQIPDEPAGPAVEHRDLGMLVMAGPGIKKDQLIHGASLLDITPTLLTLCGLPVGDDMDGKPLVQAFETPPEVRRIPSWDALPGNDGRHAESLRFDPLAAKAALEQLVALGYVEDAGPDIGKAVERTAREMRYNLARSYMNADLYFNAIPILKELQEREPEETRFGVQLAMCYRTTRDVPALRSLVEQLRVTRKVIAQKAVENLKTLRQTIKQRKLERDGIILTEATDEAETAGADEAESPLLTADERRNLKRWSNQRNQGGYDLDFLMSCVLLDEGHFDEALACLAKAELAEPNRPGLHIQIGETCLRMKQWQRADDAYSKALSIDPLNFHAHLGLARAHHARRRYEAAAREALETVRLMFHYPLAHFILGRALFRLRRFEAAEKSLSVATDLNPNFVQAHRMLLWIYRYWVSNPDAKIRHGKMLAQLRSKRIKPQDASLAAAQDEFAEAPHDELASTTPPLPESIETYETLAASRDRWPDAHSPADFVTVVAGLPRSGTSMLMQMLDAGGMEIMTDSKRKADVDNPKGYYELEKATQLRKKRDWVGEARHKAIKIVAQLLPYLPHDIPCRVIFIERNLDEVSASQKTMLKRLKRDSDKFTDQQIQAAYLRQLEMVKHWLRRNSNVWVLYVHHHEVIAQPEATAAKINQFLGSNLDTPAMASVVDPTLYRQKLAQLNS